MPQARRFAAILLAASIVAGCVALALRAALRRLAMPALAIGAALALASTACSPRSSASARPALAPHAVASIASYDRGCWSVGRGAWISPTRAVTASHVVVDLDAQGRTACEIEAAGGETIMTGQHAIPAGAVYADGERAAVVTFAWDDGTAAVVEVAAPLGATIWVTGVAVAGACEVVLGDGVGEALAGALVLDGPGAPYVAGVAPVPGWSGAPVVQAGRVVGVVTTAEWRGAAAGIALVAAGGGA